MLWGLIVVLVILWLLGVVVAKVSGFLIHLLLVIAAILIVYQFVTGRSAI